VAHHVAVDGLALWQTWRDQCLELNDVGRGELEGVERRLQYLDGAAATRVYGRYRSHDRRIRGTTVGIDEQYLAGVHAVQGDQLPDEYLVRRTVVEYVESEAERVTHLRSVYITTRPVRDPHHHCG